MGRMAKILNTNWDRFEVHSSLNIKILAELQWKSGEGRLCVCLIICPMPRAGPGIAWGRGDP